jgi:glyoxylase-like metal-dependent hydrolase (beta-lactamase superfamily II)
VDVLQIDDGLWRWTAYHEEWKEEVGCTFVATPEGVVLVDPLVPGEDEAKFWKALDRDVKRAKGRVHVLVTVFWHTRSAKAMRERYDARIWAPKGGKAAIARRAGVVTDAFAIGDELPGGIEGCRTARAAEVVYWVPEHSALVPGDVLIADGKGGAKLCPESWLPEKTTHRDLAASLRPLLDLPVRRILLSHGKPVVTGGGRALARALEI